MQLSKLREQNLALERALEDAEEKNKQAAEFGLMLLEKQKVRAWRDPMGYGSRLLEAGCGTRVCRSSNPTKRA